MREVPATELTRNFRRYREIAQREPVTVNGHGRATGYFVSAVEYEELQRLKAVGAKQGGDRHDERGIRADGSGSHIPGA